MGNKNFQLILASQSPRRRELLKSLYLPFKVRPADLEEVSTATSPEQMVIDLAKQKAEFVLNDGNAKEWVIGADTIVFSQGKVLGKPTCREDASQMLMGLSGKHHKVYTGVSVQSHLAQDSFFVETVVKFRLIEKDLLELYLDTGESMDKAGSYGIQSLALAFIESVQGSYSNVVGLPVDYLLATIKKMAVEQGALTENWRHHFS